MEPTTTDDAAGRQREAEAEAKAQTEAEAEVRDTLASFDFDGLFFQEGAGWKVQKASLGVVGSRVPGERAYAAFREILRENPDASVEEYFALDEYEVLLGDPDASTANQAPMSRMLHYAHHHLFRRADLMVAVPRGFLGLIREMTDRAFARLETFLMFENPFHRAVRRHPFDREEVLPIGSDERLAVHVAFYAALLRYHDRERPPVRRLRERFAVDGPGYEKIYVYHTEPRLEERLREFLRDNHEKLVGGRNAIVPMVLADVRNLPRPGGTP